MSEPQLQIEQQLQRYYLVIQQGVEASIDALIVDARSLIDDLLNQYGSRWKITPTQANNLFNVCLQAVTVQEVIGYIQYQIGRDKENNVWALDFGEKLVGDLQELEHKSKGIVNVALECTCAEGVDDKHEQTRVWLMLTRQYVGHLRRYLVYKRPRES